MFVSRESVPFQRVGEVDEWRTSKTVGGEALLEETELDRPNPLVGRKDWSVVHRQMDRLLLVGIIVKNNINN